MKISRVIFLAAAAAMLAMSLSGCYFLPEEEEVYDPPVVKASEVSYTTTTATRKDLVKQVVAAGTITSGTESNVAFTEYGGSIKQVYVSAGDTVEEGQLLAELETYALDKEITIKEMEVYREELEYQIAVENGESETVKAKEKLDVELMQNELDGLLEQKAAAAIYADVAGTVSYVRTLSPGNWVNAGDTIVTIIDITDLYIDISPTTEVGEFLIGRPLSIRYEGEYYDGVVVRVAFKDEVPMSSSVGNIADAVLVLDSREDVIVISANLIKTDNGQQVVYLFKNNERVRTPVTTGLQSGSSVEITSGLEEGDEIIIR